jgi:protein FrlC
MKLGIATSVYVNFPIQEAIRHIADAGYDGIDIWGGRPHVYRRDFSRQELEEIERLLEDLQLSVPSFMPAFYRYPHSLTSPNETVRQDSLDYMRECIDSGVSLGAELVLIVPGRSLHGQTREDAWKRITDSIEAVCRYASQYQIKLGVEAVNPYVSDVITTTSDALRMIEQFEYENLGVVLDSGHLYLNSEPVAEAIESAGDRLLQIHVNDNDGLSQLNLIPGDGTFDFERLVQVLKQSRFGGFVSAELGYQYTLDPDPAVRLTAERMRKML